MTFVPTVTITLAEYDKLRADAAPVQNRIRMTRDCLVDAYEAWGRVFQEPAAHRKLGAYLRYVQRCVMKGSTPVPFEEHELWMQP